MAADIFPEAPSKQEARTPTEKGWGLFTPPKDVDEAWKYLQYFESQMPNLGLQAHAFLIRLAEERPARAIWLEEDTPIDSVWLEKSGYEIEIVVALSPLEGGSEVWRATASECIQALFSAC